MKIESINFTMDDGIECPDCHSTDTYQYDRDTTTFNNGRDTTTFNNGRGAVNTSHYCRGCDRRFKLHTNFEYQITEQVTGY